MSYAQMYSHASVAINLVAIDDLRVLRDIEQ
jgi:hypothetical protein